MLKEAVESLAASGADLIYTFSFICSRKFILR